VEIVHPRVYEHNIRYESQAGDLCKQGIVLRLRRDTRTRLTYKAPAAQASPGSVSRQELETVVGDFDAMDAILQHLGYRPFMVYEKYRTTYRLPGVADAELMLDEMPYGTFLEVEGPPASIDAALSQLGLVDAPRILVSYAELFERVRTYYQLAFTDLTFENFTGLEVEPAAFRQPVKPDIKP
jgi:adenylate cyclase class 2